MSIMELVIYPSNLLVGRNAMIHEFGPTDAERVEDMFRIMTQLQGVGLAAPQVGWNVRLFILGVVAPKDGELIQRVVWNPTIQTFGAEILMMEGCLSFPKIFGRVRRWTRARLTGMTPAGPIDEVFTGFAAQAVQHEMDHVEGILFIERMELEDRAANAELLRELADSHLKKK